MTNIVSIEEELFQKTETIEVPVEDSNLNTAEFLWFMPKAIKLAIQKYADDHDFTKLWINGMYYIDTNIVSKVYSCASLIYKVSQMDSSNLESRTGVKESVDQIYSSIFNGWRNNFVSFSSYANWYKDLSTKYINGSWEADFSDFKYLYKVTTVQINDVISRVSQELRFNPTELASDMKAAEQNFKACRTNMFQVDQIIKWLENFETTRGNVTRYVDEFKKFKLNFDQEIKGYITIFK